MILESIAVASCLLALVPAMLFVRNLSRYQPLPRRGLDPAKCSVLIPARNEAANIAAAVQSALASENADLEVIVLDDGSDDRTADIVRELAHADCRVRLEIGRPPPAGWCGKNFACHQLARLARHPLLIFMDADVRCSRRDSLTRLAHSASASQAGLVSGVPHQETKGLMEKLIVPLIHFVLLGFLSLRRMQKSTDPRFGAACGQIMAVKRDVYDAAGGHLAIARNVHDGLALARRFRASGFQTGLFDATDTFHCRMYSTPASVWNGFAKNAHEGLGSPRLIFPASLILLGGQVLPLVLLALSSSPFALATAALGTVAGFLPRLIAILRFRQSLIGAFLHPLAICVLLAIQWSAFFRHVTRRPSTWKGRSCDPAPAL